MPMKEKPEYPRLSRLGITINESDDGAPPGCSAKELNHSLAGAGLLGQWERWAGDGLTCGPNGIYPWDVEAFLSGRANLD